MFKLKLLFFVPILAAVVAVSGLFLFSRAMLDESRMHVETQLKSAAPRVRDSVQAVLDGTLRAAWNASVASGELFARTQGQPDSAALRGRLREASGEAPGAYSAIVEKGGRIFDEFPVDPRMRGLCANSPYLLAATGGAQWAGFTSVDKTLFILALSPVRTGGTAAALCVSRPVTAEMFEEMKRRTGPDITVFEGNIIYGTTLSGERAGAAGAMAEKKAGIYTQGVLKGGYAPFLQQAPEYFSLVVPDTTSVNGGFFSMVLTVPFADVIRGLGRAQMIYVIIALIAFLLIAWFSISACLSAGRAVKGIEETLSAVARGNMQAQVPVAGMPDPFSSLAEAINRTIYLVRERIAGRRKDTDVVAAAELPAEPPANDAPPRAHTSGVHKAAPAAVQPSEVPPPVLPPVPPPVQHPVAAAAVKQAPPPLKVEQAKDENEEKTRELGSAFLQGAVREGEDIFRLVEEIKAGAQKPVEEPSGGGPRLVASLPPEPLATVVLTGKSHSESAAQVLEDTLFAVYNEFLQTRLRCGEEVESLSRDRFVEKLKKTRFDVIAKVGCTDVRFSVGERDGKATIKAMPIR
ncbi:MAG: MXAN_5187 C-terminal domain-containing protein [Myxococcota bacterium]|jgi:HAMP domain-containing protein